MGAVLRGLEPRGPRRAPHELALFTRVANRLAEPLSTLACDAYWLTERAYLPEAAALTRDHLYCALDFLDTHSEASERASFLRTAELFRADVALIVWDTTRVDFEVDDADTACATKRDTTLPPLRKRGYTKAGRGQQPQVVGGLALTRDGLPVRSWGFPGNTVDATTVAHVQESLRGWQRGRAIFVGDAGLDAEANRQALAHGLGPSLLAMPVGQLTEVQEEVLGRPGRFRPVQASLEVKEVVVGAGERRRRSMVCRNVRVRGSASTVRRYSRHCGQNWHGVIRRPPTIPSGPARGSPPSATVVL
jgi:hypothetical protein